MPILKEFDLDLPYPKDNERIEEIAKKMKIENSKAAQLDYEQNWKDKRSSFGFETRCICALYKRYFLKFKTLNFWKIIVECVEVKTKPYSRVVGGVCEVQVVFKVDEFFNLTDHDKKSMSLQLLKKGLDEVISEKQLDKAIFDNAYNKVIEQNYINSWVCGKAIKSPTKEYLAEVFCEHGVYSFDISIIIKRLGGTEVIRNKIKSELPDELCFDKHLGGLKWISNNEVIFTNKTNTEKWSVKI